MRKFLIHIARFLALFCLVFFGISSIASFNRSLEKKIFSNTSFHGATSLRIPDLKSWAQSADSRKKMLFLGPSTLYRGVDPEILSDESWIVFNGGSSGQRNVNGYFILDFVLDFGHVDAVVLDVFPRLWGNGTGVESARDHVVNNPEYPALAFAKMAVASQDVRNVFLAAFYAIKRGVYNRDEVLISANPEDDYKGNGFVYSSNKKMKKRNLFPETTSMTRREWRYFKRIESRCRKEGILFIVLIPPEVYPTRYISPFNSEMNIIDAQAAPIDSNLFYDNHHLLGPGAAVYSSWLKDQLSPFLAE